MKSNSRYLVFFILDVKFELNSCLPFSLEVELFTVTGAVECGDPDGNSNALNGEAIIGKLLCIKILLFYAFINAIPGGFLCIIIPGVGEDAAPADSQGLAVVSISIGATSEGSE